MTDRQRHRRWLIMVAGGGGLVALAGKKGDGYRNTPLWRAYDEAAQFIDRQVGWDKVATPIGILVLIGIRNILIRKNLFDTMAAPSTSWPVAPPFQAAFLRSRTADGSHNDLTTPTMGMAGTRFGRNVPVKETMPEELPAILEPNPRTVSQVLLTRHEFLPARSLNLLAAAWIQFMVKDWFSHGQGDANQHWEVELAPQDPWFERPMKILKTLVDPTRHDGGLYPPTFINHETPWWDASQIYGTTLEQQRARRTMQGGKLEIGADGLIHFPADMDPKQNPSLTPGWWLGLNMMETVFMREHNVICDRFHAEYPVWSDEEIFQRARLVVSALIAKIHTVEWTPAIINHPTTVAAMKINWWGLASERIRKTFGRISRSDVISGIPGSDTDHYGVPFSLTEEFSAVYRMHPLIPDSFDFRSASDNSPKCTKTFLQISGPYAQQTTGQIDMADIFYSFGTSNPGAIVLNNYPKSLQKFQRPDQEDIFMDLAATDILRVRELGVPRYNQFRRLLHMKPAQSFEDLCDDPGQVAALRVVYGDIERLDLMVGMFAERRPDGFAFSDTAFRIFILMASRRLKSDRFLSRDFRPEVYTQLGLDWVQDNTMLSVLQRHYPTLVPAICSVDNAFVPWALTGPPN